MENKIKYKINIIDHIKESNYVNYIFNLIEINSPNNIIDFKERYSSLLDLHNLLLSETNSKNFPKFPPKKFFGSNSETFIIKRQKELNSYFKIIFENQQFYYLKSLQNWIKRKVDLYNNNNKQKENNNQNNNIINDYKEEEEKSKDTSFINLMTFENDGIEKLEIVQIDNYFNHINFDNSNLFNIDVGDDKNFDLIGNDNQIFDYEKNIIEYANFFDNVIEKIKSLYRDNNENFWLISNY